MWRTAHQAQGTLQIGLRSRTKITTMQFLFRWTDEKMKYTGNQFCLQRFVFFLIVKVNSKKITEGHNALSGKFSEKNMSFFRYSSKMTFWSPGFYQFPLSSWPWKLKSCWQVSNDETFTEALQPSMKTGSKSFYSSNINMEIGLT